MVREFKEETNIDTVLEQWQVFGSHQRPGMFNADPSSYSLYLLSTTLTPDQMAQLQQTTEEAPIWQGLYDGTLSDLLHQDYAVNGTLLYVAMALNHAGRPLSTMTIEL